MAEPQSGPAAEAPARARADDVLSRANELLSAQNGVLAILAQYEDFETVLGEICGQVQTALPGSACAIMLHEPITHTLRVGAGPSLPNVLVRALSNLPVGPLGASAAASVFHGRPVVVENIVTSPLWEPLREAVRRSGLRSCWSVPIRQGTGARREGRVVGTLDLYSEALVRFDARRLEVQRQAADLIGLVLELSRARDVLYLKQHYDGLTDLPNRRLFAERLTSLFDQQKGQPQEERTRFLVGVLDIDDFREVNDTLGFQVGDVLLRAVGERLARELGESDILARSGADEFLLVVHSPDHDKEVLDTIGKILAKVNQPYDFGGQSLHVSTTIGVSVYPWDGEDPQTLMRNAQAALQAGKERGGGVVEIFRPDMAQSRPTIEGWFQQTQLASELRDALRRGELELYYQLKYRADTLEPCGAEGLVRWNHPQRGLLLPAQFLELARHTGSMIDIGNWVLGAVVEQIRTWRDDPGIPRFPVSVNVSPIQFHHGHLPQRVKGLLEAAGVSADLLELEIVERVVMEDSALHRGRLRTLQTLGIAISIDDFGTGFSSLSYLNRFHFDALKIDRSFISEIGSGGERDQDNRNIVLAVLSMARNLSLSVVAEGVETEEQLDFLRSNGCDMLQGFYFDRPRPAGQVTEALRARAARKAR